MKNLRKRGLEMVLAKLELLDRVIVPLDRPLVCASLAAP